MQKRGWQSRSPVTLLRESAPKRLPLIVLVQSITAHEHTACRSPARRWWPPTPWTLPAHVCGTAEYSPEGSESRRPMGSADHAANNCRLLLPILLPRRVRPIVAAAVSPCFPAMPACRTTMRAPNLTSSRLTRQSNHGHNSQSRSRFSSSFFFVLRGRSDRGLPRFGSGAHYS